MALFCFPAFAVFAGLGRPAPDFAWPALLLHEPQWELQSIAADGEPARGS